ncbi:CPBP family intramembrane glutamic endopeptidase [Flavobacterium sp. Fl-77]|uniref:CPBP family intramembrane glutamic endopeptidase n=1 Tax=Flavobacterium flavipigmentatum TaxID=2893884 RepID=A0AAJ2SC60_9FLAO|nr:MULTISPECIES: CPBP family intramembrane glutamic endopeptidase [unclassified Flavobacterium]MDX6184028.1 CPBP family intramembrane glutamic endopeptidase [Flavobacterium sp. Fl-33]MDX6187581.1 CPBP family intramembrane glutamic endopeptidase [Flavobacterium sp. Fl-77]UFH38473.1 CPBP family intramembrane metalloprotease [Flavobacterium sp. F-70]
MFLEQGISPENKFWKYLIGSVFIIAASFIGQIPFSVAVLYKSYINKQDFPSENAVIMKVFEPNLTLFLVMLSFVFAFAGVFFVVKYWHSQTLLSITTSRKKIDWKRVFFSFALWATFSVVSFFILYFNAPDKFISNFKWEPFLILCFIGVIFIPIQTSTEEYIFRGYLMQGFANLAHNKWFPLVMTSLIFGSMHWFNPEVTKMGSIVMIYYIGTGFLLGIITLMDEGIELVLGFHAANNLTGALLVTSDWSVFQTHSIFRDLSEPSAGFDVILPVVIVYPILLYIFSKKYKWSDWKQKLTGKINVVESSNQ